MQNCFEIQSTRASQNQDENFTNGQRSRASTFRTPGENAMNRANIQSIRTCCEWSRTHTHTHMNLYNSLKLIF